MTGPVQFEYEGRFPRGAVCQYSVASPPPQAREGEVQGTCRVVTFGCRLNAVRVRGDPPQRRSRRRSATPSWSTPAPSPPKRCARRARPSARSAASGRMRASSSPAARRRPSRRRFAAMPEVDRVLGNEEKLDAASWAGLDAAPRGRGRRHHGGEGTDAASRSMRWKATPAASCRCRPAAITAAPSASFRSAAAIRARCRWRMWWRRCAAWPRTAIARWC